MKKMISFILILFLLTSGMGINVYAQTGRISAVFMDYKLVMNGKTYTLAGFGAHKATYFHLRDLAILLSGSSSQFDIKWDPISKSIDLIRGQAYQIKPGESYSNPIRHMGYETQKPKTQVKIDGLFHSFDMYMVEGNTYIKVLDLEDVLGFKIEKDPHTTMITHIVPISKASMQTSQPVTNNNAYIDVFPTTKSTLTDYILDNKDGSYSIVESKGSIVSVDIYNLDNELIGYKSIQYELPLFGGFYSGKSYNYIAFGQENTEENYNKEVIRIVKYDKNFNRLDSVSIKGGQSYTIKPFHAGSGRMDEKDNYLVFHTSRLRYRSSDGLNHQSQLTLLIDTDRMNVKNYLGEFQNNHVSHSFDQYAKFDGNNPIYLDHGDAYPRSIVLVKGDLSTTKNKYPDEQVDIFKIPGRTGANATGVSIGGLEISNENYLVAFNSIHHKQARNYSNLITETISYDQRDIILSILPRGSISSSDVRNVVYGKYIGTDKNATIPHLVKINDNKFALLWQEYDRDRERLGVRYIFVDGNGESISELKTDKTLTLSDCRPIVIENRIVWYLNNMNHRVLQSIDL